MIDGLWQQLKDEAERVVKEEPLLASYVYACVLNHKNLASALSFILANKLSDDVMPVVTVRELFDQAFAAAPEIIENASCDINAVYERDAAIRLAHYLWTNNRRELALFIQSRNSEFFGVDIHPACVMGRGIMFDHATGIVIGETSVIEDNVSILQQVTLGGTGNEQGDRHPKIRSGVLISTGAKVLGNIEIGEGAKVGAGSVVLSDVAAHTTVVGVPAKVVGKPLSATPSETMDQSICDDEP